MAKHISKKINHKLTEAIVPDDFNNLTIEMIKKLYEMDLEEYIEIHNIGPFGEGNATLERIEGGEWNTNGWAHGYEGYEEEGYEDEDEALEAFLKDNTVFVFSKDIGQSGCNWLDENQLIEYLDDMYFDAKTALRNYSGNKDVAKAYFKEAGIVEESKPLKTTIEYTVTVEIESYEDWEEDYDGDWDQLVKEGKEDFENELDGINLNSNVDFSYKEN